MNCYIHICQVQIFTDHILEKRNRTIAISMEHTFFSLFRHKPASPNPNPTRIEKDPNKKPAKADVANVNIKIHYLVIPCLLKAIFTRSSKCFCTDKIVFDITRTLQRFASIRLKNVIGQRTPEIERRILYLFASGFEGENLERIVRLIWKIIVVLFLYEVT